MHSNLPGRVGRIVVKELGVGVQQIFELGAGAFASLARGRNKESKNTLVICNKLSVANSTGFPNKGRCFFPELLSINNEVKYRFSKYRLSNFWQTGVIFVVSQSASYQIKRNKIFLF